MYFVSSFVLLFLYLNFSESINQSLAENWMCILDLASLLYLNTVLIAIKQSKTIMLSSSSTLQTHFITKTTTLNLKASIDRSQSTYSVTSSLFLALKAVDFYLIRQIHQVSMMQNVISMWDEYAFLLKHTKEIESIN